MDRPELPSEIADFASRNSFIPSHNVLTGYCSTVYTEPSRVLKLPFQGEEQTSGFHAAYTLQSVEGPIIFDGDQTTGALLMERLCPGTSLIDQPETEAIQTFIQLAKKMRDLPTDHCLPLENYYSNLPPEGHELIKTTTTKTFLHGDLHHENILLHKGKWRPIDPKGLVGDPAYECAAFLRNPLNKIPERKDLFEFTIQRIETMAKELDLDPTQIAGWAYVDRWETAQEEPENLPWVHVANVFKKVYDHFQEISS